MVKSYKSNPIFWLLLVSLGVLYGCGVRETPDPFYAHIKGVKLAIPKSHIHAGSQIDGPDTQDVIQKHPSVPPLLRGPWLSKSHDEVRARAATSPGIDIQVFYMLLNSDDGKPWIHNPSDRAIPNYLKVWLADETKTALGPMPHILAARILTPEKRLPSRDEFELTAYGGGRALPTGDLNYSARLADGSMLLLRCSGFNLPNPICKATGVWQGLLLEYSFRHIYLAQWRAIHGRVTDLLNSFLYPKPNINK